jgi:putative membrane protein
MASHSACVARGRFGGDRTIARTHLGARDGAAYAPISAAPGRGRKGTFMSTISVVLAVLVAAEHLGFLVLEMFLWQKPIGLRFFRLTPEIAAASARLAANQGLYNGFVTAGIVAGLLVSDRGAGFALIVFSLSCVIAAGVFAAFTVSWRTLVVQAVPGAVALAALVFLR